ncbi:hypothetical protein [Alkaliphilus crotonatoxidans]
MKKLFSFLLAALLFVGFPATTFGQVTNVGEADFNLYIDYWNTAEQVYVINGIEFKVLASEPITPKARFTASKTVEMRDLYNDAKLGSVYVWASCVNDGTYVSASSYGSSIINKPTSSDLRVTSTTISDNGTTLLSVQSNIAYTGSRGENAFGAVTLYVKGDGTYF